MGDDDELLFNVELNPKKRTFRAPKLTALTKKVADELQRTVNEERKYMLDAALVRMMKARRTMNFTVLIYLLYYSYCY